MGQTTTRREFVRTGLVLVAGATALATGACSMPSPDEQTGVETPTSSFGGSAMTDKRVLIGYATRNGSTVGVAEEIGRTLAALGYAVDVQPIKDAPALDDYDAVVLGSAINGGQWLPEAVSYAQANADALSKMPTAIFCVHAMNTGDDENDVRKRRAYLDKVRALVSPDSEGYFAGVGPLAKDTNPIARWAFRAFGGDVEGDGRDWDAIRAWAGDLAI